MKKVLIITQAYPNKENPSCCAFVHSRVKSYKKNNNLTVNILSFSAKKTYIYEGVRVLSLSECKEILKTNFYDIIISHAPNIRCHCLFLIKFANKYRKVVFVIHGHEVMITDKDYAPDYIFLKHRKKLKKILTFFYDRFKIVLLKIFFENLIKNNKVNFIFVSHWMKKIFIKNIKIKEDELISISTVINNNCNEVFIHNTYDNNAVKYADFITLRPFDNSKYGVDLVLEMAKNNSKYSYHIYGKGEYFKYNDIPSNVQVFYNYFNQQDIAKLLSHYRCAVMPTRVDAQGVMMCEMATFGIPVLTSNIEVCRDMLSEFKNVEFINNEHYGCYVVDEFLNNIHKEFNLNKHKFSIDNTINKEIEYVCKL